MIILATILSGVSLLMSVLLLIKTKNPIGWITMIPKAIAGALSPYCAIIGAAGAIIGAISGAYWAIPMGIFGAGMMIWYAWQCTRGHNGFEDAFGDNWKDQIPPEQARQMVKRRWSPYLNMKASPDSIWERDLPFWTVPGTDRQLLCDLWRPAEGDVSGLAFIYFHGSGWAVFDKDFCTRSFFRHLVSQGHTVMDVAYRLCPEVDIHGMIADVKRAVAWMKANGPRYGVDPQNIVLGGGSAGAHLTLLAAYTPGHPALTPDELKGTDLSVCGVISYYGPTDMLAVYQHANLRKLEGQPTVPIGTKVDSIKAFNYAARFDLLLGGWPQDVPDMYTLASPISHVQPGCPPTLLIQGNQDFLTSVDATIALNKKLVESGVPAINVVYPWTDHGFDMLLPQTSPPIQSALYDVDRFLALLLNTDQNLYQYQEESQLVRENHVRS
jgi:acetyl esterase/lipase